MTRYRKPYQDPHGRLKTALAALLLLALTEKRKLLLDGKADAESAAGVAFLLHGGNAGKAWCESIVKGTA